MKRERRLLLCGLLIGVGLTILSIFLSPALEKFMGEYASDVQINKKVEFYLDLVSYILYGMGVIYYLILIIFKKIDINKHASGLLFWSIILLLSNIVTGIFGIIVYKGLDRPKKRELPVIEDKEFTNKYVCFSAFITCMVIMFIISKHVSGFIPTILIYVSIFVIMIGVFFKQLVHDFKIFKEYFKEYMGLIFKTWLKALLFMTIFSLIISIFTGESGPNNQQSLQTMFNSLPVLTALLAVLYAPFAEELMFRGVFKKFIKSKYLFILTSGVLFGLLHVIDDSKTLAEFSYVIVYSILGIYLASIYHKTNNLFCNISMHFLQNLLGTIAMILIYLS